MPSGSTLDDARSAGRAGVGAQSVGAPGAGRPRDVRVGVDRVVDAEGASVSLTDDADVWSLLALTGGHRARVFGELEESRLRPLTVVLADEVVGL